MSDNCCQRLYFGDDPAEELNSSTDSGSDPGLVPQTPKPKQKQVGKVTPMRRAPLTPELTPVAQDASHSPPTKGLRTLRLINSPQTPKTLLERSQRDRSETRVRTRLFEDTGSPIRRLSRLAGMRTPGPPARQTPAKQARLPMKTPLIERKQVNVNPFTPRGILECQRKRPRDDTNDNNNQIVDCDTAICSAEDQLERQAKIQRMYLSPNDEAYSRYEKEFLELDQIGNGEFGAVFKSINRLDGCIYAIKKLKKPMQGSAEEKASLTEVWAHAVLGVNKHVVRYYSAWAEHNHMIIQNEFCNGGSLHDQVKENIRNGEAMTEVQLRRLTLHIAHGLKFIHGQNLVHMDIKPGNIFISRSDNASEDDGFVEDEIEEGITYKIGDLGLVTSSVHPEVEEGDCRYMAPELLRDDHSNLQKADIFSLGMTIYEVGLSIELPKNGEEWQQLRRGELRLLTHCSTEFNQLLQRMCHPQPEKRPTAQQLVCDSCLVPYADKSKAQLHMELNIEKFRTRVLEQQLAVALGFQVPQCPADVRLNFDFLSNPPPFTANRTIANDSSQSSNNNVSSSSSSSSSQQNDVIGLKSNVSNNKISGTNHSSNNHNDTNNNPTVNNNNNSNNNNRTIAINREFPAARRNLFVGRGTMRSNSVQNF